MYAETRISEWLQVRFGEHRCNSSITLAGTDVSQVMLWLIRVTISSSIPGGFWLVTLEHGSRWQALIGVELRMSFHSLFPILTACQKAVSF